MAPKKKAEKTEASQDGAEDAKTGEAKEEPEAKEEAKDEEVKEEAKEEANDEVKEEAKDVDMQEEPEAKDEEMQEEPDKELEEDAADDSKKRVAADAVSWSAVDSTLNVMRVNGGNLLMSVTEGGFQYLLAGVRSTVGLKAGRYMFEVKIVESLHISEPHGSQGRTPAPKNLVRVGVSLAGSSLFLADTPDSVCFDSEGYFFHGKKRSKISERFSRESTVALLVNLDASSPNANTVSLFRDGQRISKPQKLPENLQGKVLYPSITYKNVTLHVNLGPVPKTPLPFKCRMVQDAAADDLEIASQPSSKGPCEVVFPVGMPDKGAFDYADFFLEKNSQFTELSDRKFLEWASKSGIWRPKGYTQRSSVDKPELNFGIALMDDQSVSEVLHSLAPAMKRNYLVMELRGNLLAEERRQALQRFSGPDFKKVAHVIMGEPTAEYKQKVQALMLAEKEEKAAAEKRKKAAEEERKRLLEEKKKKAAEARQQREAKRNAGKESAATEDTEAKDEKETKEDEDMGVEKETKEEEAKMEEEARVELTEEEKKLWFRPSTTPDLTQATLAKSYSSFTIPTKEEGFDEIRFVWQPKDKVEADLRDWLLEQKRTQRAEELEPSDWFKGQHEAWRKALQEWKRTQNERKDPAKRKAYLKKKEEEAKKKKTEAAEGNEEPAEAEKADAKTEPAEINVSEIEVDTVEDITDLGNGMPLFLEFVYEDWALLSMRYEMHLLINAFRRDLNDADRPSFREEHFAYYYEKYYKKTFVLKNFGVESFADFMEMLEDSIALAEGSGMLESKLPEDHPHANFVKLAEEHRRDRARRVDAGDETAQLKFKKPAPPPPTQGSRRPAPAPTSQGGGDYKSDKGGKGSSNRSSYSKDTPPTRYGNSSSYHSSKETYSSGGHHSGGGSSYRSGEKRSYGSSGYPAAKESRTSSYSGGGDRYKGSGGHSRHDDRGGRYNSGYGRR